MNPQVCQDALGWWRVAEATIIIVIILVRTVITMVRIITVRIVIPMVVIRLARIVFF